MDIVIGLPTITALYHDRSTPKSCRYLSCTSGYIE